MDRLFNYPRPRGLEEFVINSADENFCLVDNQGNHHCQQTGKRCTQWDIVDWQEGIKHGDRITCKLTCKSCTALKKQYGRKKHTEYGRVMWFRKAGRATFIQVDDYTIDYQGDRPKVYFDEWEQFKLSKDEQLHVKKKSYYYYTESGWQPVKTMRTTQALFYNGWNSKYDKLICFNPSNLGTDLGYADVDLLDEGKMTLYLSEVLLHPGIEILQKAGFRKIIDERLNGKGSPYINWNGKNLEEIFRMPMGDIRYLKRRNASIDDINAWRIIKRCIEGISIEEAFKINTKHWKLEESLRRLKDNGLNHRHTVKYLLKNEIQIGDYADYINDCNKLEKDLHNRRIARPKDFQEEHQRLANLVKVHIKEIEQQQFKENEKKISKMEEPYIYENLLIRPARDSYELDKESEGLGHCVRTYTSRVVQGSCAIMFIRQLTEPDKPYYTLELNTKHEVVQCRGKSNCSTTPEIEAFIKEWRGATYGKHSRS